MLPMGSVFITAVYPATRIIFLGQRVEAQRYLQEINVELMLAKPDATVAYRKAGPFTPSAAADIAHDDRGIPVASFRVCVLGGGPWPTSFNRCADAAARAELAFHNGPNRFASLDDVFQNLVDDVFLEDAQIAKAE